MPVESPAISAISTSVRSSLPATVLASPRTTSASSERIPSLVFTPVTMAVMVGAESAVCWLTE
jgi:hypothetical protein